MTSIDDLDPLEVTLFLPQFTLTERVPGGGVTRRVLDEFFLVFVARIGVYAVPLILVDVLAT